MVLISTTLSQISFSYLVAHSFFGPHGTLHLAASPRGKGGEACRCESCPPSPLPLASDFTAALQKKPWLSAPLDFKWSLDKPAEAGCYGILGCSASPGLESWQAFFLSKAMKGHQSQALSIWGGRSRGRKADAAPLGEGHTHP